MKKTYLLLFFCFNLGIGQNSLTHEVYFETNKHEVLSTEENRLLLFVSTLDTITIEKIAIYGFCDDRGTENYNLKLSQNRAASVKSYLVKKGINEERVLAKGYGESDPIADNYTENGRKLNRRTEVRIISE